MTNSELEPRNVNLTTTDWREIEAYRQQYVGVRSVSAALRYMLRERRNLRTLLESLKKQESQS